MRSLFFQFLACVLLVGTAAAQGNLPKTPITNLMGKKVEFASVIKPGKITVVSFWATWCVPCKKEIKNIQAKLPAWQKEAEFDFVAVSIDDSKSSAMVKPFVISQKWNFPVFIDANSDLKRALSFQSVPYTIIIDQKGKIAWNHAGYEEGGENEVIKKVKELAAAK